MRQFYFFLVLLLLTNCCAKETVLSQGPMNPDGTAFTYLALGDSYTIGESVDETERYPVQLGDSLKQFDIELNPIHIVARTGWTTGELATGIAARSDLRETYDLVTLLIGVNNQYRNRSITVYEEEFRALLEQAIAFANSDLERVFVISIPDYAFTSAGNGDPEISAGIDEFNAVNKRVAGEYNVEYFDITPISREGLDQTDLVARDGLHPSGIQYSSWVSLMLPTIKEELEK